MAIFGFLQTSDPVLEIVRQSARRKADAELRLKFYHDRQTDELLEAIRRRWSNPEDFRLFAVNIVKKVVRQKAKVYSAAPARLFEGLDQTAGDDLYRDLVANVVLKKANRLTKLLKTTMLQVTWNGKAKAFDGTVVEIATAKVARTGIYEIPLSGAQIEHHDPDAAAIRVKATLGGTTPSIKYGAYLVPAF